MEDIAQLLAQTQDPNPQVQTPATNKLLEFAEKHYDQYLIALTDVLGSDDKPANVRTAAALQIKVTLTGQDEFSRNTKHELWRNLPENMKQHIKDVAVNVLGRPNVGVARQAAQVIEAVARWEFADGRWTDLAPLLIKVFDAVHQRNAGDIIGPLLALGYFAGVAADTDMDVEETQVNALLSKISIGMNLQMPEVVQTAAIDALNDTLEFARHNMDNENERGIIMNMILTMTASPHEQAQEKAFQALTSVLQMYYHHLSPHMNAIWERTTQAIQNKDMQSAARQALNFWSDMCLEEKDRLQQMQEYGNRLGPTEVSLNFIEKIQQPLTQLVLEFCLLQQDEEADDDEKADDTLYGTAEHCFVNLCSLLGPSLAQYTFQFVQQNIMQQDWRRRQAALFAFGAVLRENESTAVAEAVNGLFEQVLNRMLSPKLVSNPGQQNPEPIASVRETAAWCVSNICASHITVVNTKLVQPMIVALLHTLKDKPRVAHMSATAIHSFAGAFQGHAGKPTNALSGKLFESLAAALWDAARRTDSDQWQLMEDSYEALIKLIEVSAMDMLPIVGRVLLYHSLVRLDELRTGRVQDVTGYQEVELCDVVLTCLLKLDQELFKYGIGSQQSPEPMALPNKIVETMIYILNKPSSNAHAAAFGVLGEVTRIVGPKFEIYVNHVFPLVCGGLSSRQDAQVCIAACRLCDDICNALQEKIEPLVEKLMGLVYANLQAQDLQKEVKPPHLSIMGDIAFSIKRDKFLKYFSNAMQTALHATNIEVDVTDDEMADYLNELREHALEAMELMLEVASPQDLTPELCNYVAQVAHMISMEIQDPKNYYNNKNQALVPPDLQTMVGFPYSVSDQVVTKTLGCLGAVASKVKDPFGRQIRETPTFAPLFERGKTSNNPELLEITQWCMSVCGIKN